VRWQDELPSHNVEVEVALLVHEPSLAAGHARTSWKTSTSAGSLKVSFSLCTTAHPHTDSKVVKKRHYIRIDIDEEYVRTAERQVREARAHTLERGVARDPSI